MKNLALLDDNNFVINISIADDNWDATGWLEYKKENPACIGGDYVQGYFYAPQPYPSWTRNNGHWMPLTPRPIQGIWFWDEENSKWQQLGN